MRIKTDENLPRSAAHLLRSAGHDVEETLDEGLGGVVDPKVLAACQHEKRVLITLDRGLGDIRRYPPAEHAGIVVLRARDQRAQSLIVLLTRLLPVLKTEPLTGTLWIVEEARVRVRR